MRLTPDPPDLRAWQSGCAWSCIWNDLHFVSASRPSSAPSTSSPWKPAAPRRVPGGRVIPIPDRQPARPRGLTREPRDRHQVTLAVVNVTTIGLVTRLSNCCRTKFSMSSSSPCLACGVIICVLEYESISLRYSAAL